MTLKRWSPAIWRSVRLPVTATLGDLHWVIQILFGWDGDHLHARSLTGSVGAPFRPGPLGHGRPLPVPLDTVQTRNASHNGGQWHGR